MFEIVDGRTTDGRRSDLYTISSPMSLGSGELKIQHELFISVLLIKYVHLVSQH